MSTYSGIMIINWQLTNVLTHDAFCINSGPLIKSVNQNINWIEFFLLITKLQHLLSIIKSECDNAPDSSFVKPFENISLHKEKCLISKTDPVMMQREDATVEPHGLEPHRKVSQLILLAILDIFSVRHYSTMAQLCVNLYLSVGSTENVAFWRPHS